MNKVFKLTVLFAILLAMFTMTTSFISQSDISSSDNSCTVTVRSSRGSVVKSVKVSTDVSGGISCLGGRSFYTDSDGEVTLKWSKGCYLKKVYVKGRGYDVDYRDGQRYSLTMK